MLPIYAPYLVTRGACLTQETRGVKRTRANHQQKNGALNSVSEVRPNRPARSGDPANHRGSKSILGKNNNFSVSVFFLEPMRGRHAGYRTNRRSRSAMTWRRVLHTPILSVMHSTPSSPPPSLPGTPPPWPTVVHPEAAPPRCRGEHDVLSQKVTDSFLSNI